MKNLSYERLQLRTRLSANELSASDLALAAEIALITSSTQDRAVLSQVKRALSADNTEGQKVYIPKVDEISEEQVQSLYEKAQQTNEREDIVAYSKAKNQLMIYKLNQSIGAK